jgi:H+/Cl- antiporter ClcA
MQNGLFVFLVVFTLLSILSWFMVFMPGLRTAAHQLQHAVHTLVASPFVGLVLFGLVLLIYFSVYYLAPTGLDDLPGIYTTKFILIWISCLSAVAVAAAMMIKQR